MPDHAPSALQWLIGVELAGFRERAGLSLAELATRTGLGKPKLGHLETGRSRQYPDDIATILRACGAAAHDIDRITSLASRADSSSWWAPWSDVVPDWFRTFVGLEGLAAAEFVFEPLILPGLLQTEEYAREANRRAGRVRADHEARVIEFRMARARRLTQDDVPLRLHAVVTEQALRLGVGTPEIRQAQYEHLLGLAQQANVTLQVVRPEAGPHDAMTGQFVVLDFAQARSVVYVEVQDGALYAASPGRVDTYKQSARSLEEVALPPDDSRDFIADLIT
ncbi:transcriptional regulator [Longimycelium tulufanense]|uniref:Transcriptional regulator n=1 Tax=Longimycelium tulufanense TaxID=907463 RepID=A0A8J3CK58_9PSEU|nr:helix-turn-helix transcriptional regulator [Longimycelium tulufanense]GGM82026.1 transcriptional regulator [Longimycelium tulufanense]